MKHYYTIIWLNKYGKKLISWLGGSYETEQEAKEAARAVAFDLWDTMPSLSWRIFYHAGIWKTDLQNEEPF